MTKNCCRFDQGVILNVIFFLLLLFAIPSAPPPSFLLFPFFSLSASFELMVLGIGPCAC
jgi:hypothetical protein